MFGRDARSSPNRAALTAIVVVWLSAVGFGWSRLTDYDYTPGEMAAAPRTWTDDGAAVTTVAADPTGRERLVMFVHPCCPCTRASLEELDFVVSRAEGGLPTTVVFCVDESLSRTVAESDLWNRAGRIPGVVRRIDVGGRESRRFGARTSGHVVLYGRDGRLAFRGGITAARGHVGENYGRDAVAAALGPASSARLSKRTHPVFGCPLEDR